MKRKPFVLSVKVVVRDDGGRCLLLRRSLNSENNRHKWDLPGGKVDAAENFDRALLREVTEETQLRISLEGVAGAAQWDMSAYTVAFLIMEGRVLTGQVILSSEHDEYVWVTLDEFPKMDLCPQFTLFAEQYAKSAG